MYRIFYSKKMHTFTSTTFVLLFVVMLINGLPFDADNKNSKQPGVLTRGQASCEKWHAGEPDPQIYLDQTLKPPCQIPPSFPTPLIDGWIVDPGCDASKDPASTCDLHKGAHGCYRHSYKSSGPGAQACYDKNGKWISDPWLGAGTLDVETPLGSFIQQALHGIADVLPYYDCCTDSAPQPYTCNLYYAKRPPGVCEDKPAF